MKKEETFGSIKNRLMKLKEHMKLSNEEIKLLETPEEIHESEINFKGEKYKAWRVLHNKALGPGKGGIRFHPDVSLDEVKSLAFWMSLKNSLAGIPYGGAKGGIRFNPKDKSKKDLEKISRLYIKNNYKFLGDRKDIPAPDVYTNEQTMAWMLDEYEKITQCHEPGMITGKPIELGGLGLRSDATAKGGFIIIKELLHHFENIPKNPTVTIQGFGNAGLNIAKMLNHVGFKIVAVSDSKGGISNCDGLDIRKVIENKEKGESVTSYKSAEKITNAELLEIKTDILILAALENQITENNADKIKAKFIVELANGPTNEKADEILWKKNILVIPDILANSGGVIVSYFEWAQNVSGGLFEEEFLDKKLFSIMECSWHNVYGLFKDNGSIDLRKSAYMIAIERILKAEKYRGRL